MTSLSEAPLTLERMSRVTILRITSIFVYGHVTMNDPIETITMRYNNSHYS